MYFLLAVINLLSPKAAGSRCVASAVAYGQHNRQRLDVYAPTTGSGPWPVVYFLYGGAWRLGERRYYAFAARALASAGFVVVVPDYRLVPEVEYPVFLHDCADAFAWLVSEAGRFGGDAGRVALLGHSAGAYNVAMMLMHPRLLPERALADQVKALVSLSGPFDFAPFDGPISLRIFGAARRPADTQPINHVREGLPPALLISGDRDNLVMPRNTKTLAEALRRMAVPVIERHYPGVDHPGTLLELGAFGRRGAIYEQVIGFLRDAL